MKDLGLDLARAAHDPKGLAALKRAAKGPDQEQALRAAAEEFEGLFIQQMLSAMRDTVPKEGLFSSSEESTFRSLADQQLAQDLARTGDFGIAEALVNQLGRGEQREAPASVQGRLRLHQASIEQGVRKP